MKMNKASSQFPVLSSQKNREWSDGRPRPSLWGRLFVWGRVSDPSRPSEARQVFRRWLKFNAVGAIGILIQLAVLAILRSLLHLDYLLATALAVEAAVLNNFLWHERFTWADRPAARMSHSLLRLGKFNASNGAVSIVGNLLLMRIFVGQLKLNYVAANLIAITVCSLVNFLLSDRVVFEVAASSAPQPTNAVPETGAALTRSAWLAGPCHFDAGRVQPLVLGRRPRT